MVSRHQLRHAIQTIESATQENFSEISQELSNAVTKLKHELEATDKQWQLLNNDIGKSQTLHGFDEKFFTQLNPVHSFAVQNFIRDWTEKQSDWRYPMCVIAPSTANYLEQYLKSTLVYVLSNKLSVTDIVQHASQTLNKTRSFAPRMFRTKPLDHVGNITNEHVPYNQIGTITSIDYFCYLSIEQIKQFFTSFEKILRPGGECMIHITDADCEQEWKSVVGKKITYCTIKIVDDLCQLTGLELKEYYHVDSMYTFFNIKKPGELNTQKKMPTKIEQVR